VKERSDVTSIAVVDACGLVLSGMGSAQELAILGIVLFYLVTLAEKIACPWYVVTNKDQYT
jgi:hypothetical protein